MSDTQRNLLILAVIAAVGLFFSGAFGVGAGAAFTFLNLAFMVVMIWFLVSLYQRKSGTIAMMATTPRLILQVCAALILILLVTGLLPLPLPAPFGWSRIYPAVFWPLLLASGFGIWWAWQQRTSRW